METQFTPPGPHGEIHLIGSHCLDCDDHFFPVRAICSTCFGRNLKTVELSRLGWLKGFTIVHQAPSGYFGPVPYALGTIGLDGGVSVLGNLSGKAVTEWRVGDPVESSVLRLPAQSVDGPKVDCYGFQPRQGDAGQPKPKPT